MSTRLTEHLKDITERRKRMRISRLNATGATRSVAAPRGAQKQGSTLGVWSRRLIPNKDHRGRLPLAVWAGLLRAVALAAVYVLVLVTATVVIPSLGAWLHAQSGASQSALTGAGTLAMWLMPFGFLVALLAAGEIALMRGIWRWSTRAIGRVRDARDGKDTVPTPTGPTAGPTPRGSRNNHPRSS